MATTSNNNRTAKRDGSTQDDNFRWISSMPGQGVFITLDKQQRLYLSSDARKTTNIDRGTHVIVGYDKANQRLVLANSEVVRVPNVKPFYLNEDSYISAAAIVRELNVSKLQLPLRFAYVGRDFAEYDSGSFAFERVD
ncbi:hypothetical protein [Terribacillus saccharophilus]|uniref:hypothetical protein n=1 Tax=Terribacillus saccharophilus TaxID=361277 RepID=UPI003D293663